MHDSENINFRTKIKPVKYNFEITYESNLMFIGSCFTESIGQILEAGKFKIDINPFGILYNPVSVKNAVNFLVENQTFTEDDIFFYNERWNSFYHHGRFSNPEKSKTLQIINNRITKSSEVLKNADYLFVTFGSAWVYEIKESDEIVSNCHKIPAKKFNKRILNTQEIIDVYSVLLKRIKSYNNGLKIIFTISPVRHLKDGFYENNLSKSILRLAINELINNNANCYYFPAYEILIDDLRDYRFYETDLLHPSRTAIEYIFNYFGNSFFTDETFKIYTEIQKLLRAVKHRPFNTSSNEYKQFVKKNINKIKALKNEYNFIDLKNELDFFKNKQ